MTATEPRLLYHYARIVGLTLLAQGTLTVAFLTVSDEGARRTHGILNHEARHGVLHILLGVALLVLVMREKRPRSVVLGTLTFGVFYLALAVLGIATHNPFGLHLGPGENGFHLIVGSSAVAVAGGSMLGANVSSFDIPDSLEGVDHG
jgi:hypothetical protein